MSGAKSIHTGFAFPDGAPQATCAVFGCERPSETLVVIRFPHRSLFERRTWGKPDETRNVAPATATIGMCRQCAAAIASPHQAPIVCETCGHDPCVCAEMLEAEDALYGFTCPDCGERLRYEGAWHECVDDWRDDEIMRIGERVTERILQTFVGVEVVGPNLRRQTD